MRIVLCEDDKALMGLIKVVLSGIDAQVDTCEDSNSFQDCFSKEPTDLLIVDYWLKKQKADDIIKDTQISSPKTKIILMSAISNLKEVSQDLKVDKFIKKPFNISTFKETVTQELYGKGSGGN